MRKRSKYFLFVSILVFVVILLTVWANILIGQTSNEFITDNLNNVSPQKVGLLLGTSKRLKGGQKNEYFYNRIDATVELFESGKIKFIIISGDNREINYNEPKDMKNELLKRGIPDSVIILDYAGLRTLDSVIRAKEIFGQNSFIIISQRFHNERAVFIARKNNIEAFGYNAKDVDAYNGFKTKVREIFARDKVFIDFLFGVKPKYLGEKININ